MTTTDPTTRIPGPGDPDYVSFADDRASRFAASLAVSDHEKAMQAAEAERERQKAEGDVLSAIDEMDLSIEDLKAMLEFAQNGCVLTPPDSVLQAQIDVLTEVNEKAIASLAAKEQELVDQKAGFDQVSHGYQAEIQRLKDILNGASGPVVALDSLGIEEGELNDLVAIGQMFRTDDGKLSRNMAHNAFNALVIPAQPKWDPSKDMPTGPPTVIVPDAVHLPPPPAPKATSGSTRPPAKNKGATSSGQQKRTRADAKAAAGSKPDKPSRARSVLRGIGLGADDSSSSQPVQVKA